MERELRAARPEPRGQFLDELVRRVDASAADPSVRAPGRSGRSRFALAGALTASMLVALAAFGGAGYAKSGATHAVKSTSHSLTAVLSNGGSQHRGDGRGDKGNDGKGDDSHSDSHEASHHIYPQPGFWCATKGSKVRVKLILTQERHDRLLDRGFVFTAGPLLDPDGDIQVLTAPWWAAGKRLRRLEALRHHLRAGDYDVVHAQTYLPNFYARLASVVTPFAAPVVITLQSAGDDYTGRVARLSEHALTRWSGAVTAVSPRLGEQYRQRFPRLADRVVAIPNAVEVAENPRLEAVDAPKIFATVGRLTRFKSVETAISGFAAFKQRHPDGGEVLRIIGPDTDPAYAEELRTLAARLGSDSIVFEGAVQGPFHHVPIDVLIHPSRQEGHPLTVLEAAAQGIPVICADVAEIRDAVGGHCTTFGVDDADSLAGAVAAVVADWEGARAAARLAVTHVPTIDDAAARYLAIFERLAYTHRT